MGQTFRLAAPRAKLSLPWGGKLGEILFNGSAKELVRLLAVPVRPQNSSSILKEPHVKQDIQLNCRFAQLPAGSSVQDETDSLRSVKRKTDEEVPVGHLRHHKRAKADSRTLGDVNTDHSIRFSDLSEEAHRLVFTNIEFIEDVICLSLTGRYFWGIGREYIHDHYAAFLGLWAGENIVCAGEDVKPGDFPPGLFSAEEVDEFLQMTTKILYEDDYPEGGAYTEPFTLYHFTFPTVVDMENDVDLYQESLRIYYHCRDRGDRRDPAPKLTSSEIVVTESTYLPEDQAWILRNLTTRGFVRSEAIALKPEFIHGPNIDVLGFGEVVMARICWSTSSFVSLNDMSNISKGVWAGHRFDITTVGRHKDETMGVKWRDVSEEVAIEIGGIWEQEYGPHWRETVCNLWGGKSRS